MRLRYLLCLPLALLVGCETVQTTQGGAVGVDRQQRMFSALPSAEVDRMAAESYAQMLAEARNKQVLNTDAAMVRRLRGIADELIPEVVNFRQDARNWNWEVNLIKSEELNASCAPGGKILFYSGIITRLQLTDDEIA